jgi:hypothetical protein
VTEGGVNLTVTRQEAGERVRRIVEEQRDVQRQINVRLPACLRVCVCARPWRTRRCA